MLTKGYSGTEMRRVLASIITSTQVCGRAAAVWPMEGLFDTPWANLAAGLAIRYHRKYNRAPGKHFLALFEEWAEDTATDEKTVRHIEQFLQAVSDQGEEDESECPEHLIDVAGKYFNRVAMEKTIALAEDDLKSGRVEEARSRFRNAPEINMGVGAYYEPLGDLELWMEADTAEKRPLVYYREDLGMFIGDDMVRGTLFAFAAPDKVGKTTWLIDAAYRALRNRCRVAFFEMGDGTFRRFIARFGMRAAGKPLKAGYYKLPEKWNAEHELVRYEQHIEAYNPVDGYSLVKRIGKSEDALRVECYANGCASVADLNNTLSNWALDDWRPDVVVIDYADIMAPPKGVRESLDQIDETWKALKRLSQERHCLVITATQSNAAAYDLGEARLLTKKNFSGRKTKNAHVDGMLGINVSPREKQNGAARINWIARREGEQNDLDFCRVAGSFALGNPAMISLWR